MTPTCSALVRTSRRCPLRVSDVVVAAARQARARALLLNSIHDLYIASPNSSDPAVTANQGCGYKGVELIDAPARAAKLREVAKQVGVLEGLVVGPYAAGAALTEADCALYPTCLLYTSPSPRDRTRSRMPSSA